MQESGAEPISFRQLRQPASVSDLASDNFVPRAFIISDVRLYRDGLASSLSRRSAVKIMGAGSATPAIITQVQELGPDVVVLDAARAGTIELAKSLMFIMPGIKIIAFAVSEVDQEVLAWAEAGIAGYVALDASEDDLVAAIQRVMCGELHCSARVAGLLFRQVAALTAQQTQPGERSALTPREDQILALVEHGMSNKEIARELRIGNTTVKNHVHNILEKLKVRRRGEAAAYQRAHRLWRGSRRDVSPARPALSHIRPQATFAGHSD